MNFETLRQEYLNREVKVSSRIEVIESERFGRIELTEHDSEDPLLAEIAEKITLLGLKPRVMLPNQMGTSDYRTDRVNVLVAQSGDDKFIISSIHIG